MKIVFCYFVIFMILWHVHIIFLHKIHSTIQNSVREHSKQIDNISNKLAITTLYWHIRKSNKNVDIKFSAHDAFLESGTLKIERLENQII